MTTNESNGQPLEQLTINNPKVDPADVIIGGDLAPDSKWHIPIAADRAIQSDETYTLVRLRVATRAERDEIHKHRQDEGLDDVNDDGIDVTAYIVEITTNTDIDGKVVPLDIDEWAAYVAGVQQT